MAGSRAVARTLAKQAAPTVIPRPTSSYVAADYTGASGRGPGDPLLAASGGQVLSVSASTAYTGDGTTDRVISLTAAPTVLLFVGHTGSTSYSYYFLVGFESSVYVGWSLGSTSGALVTENVSLPAGTPVPFATAFPSASSVNVGAIWNDTDITVNTNGVGYTAYVLSS